VDNRETFVGSCHPLAEAVEIIEKLLALCTRHNLKREAYSIALGEELQQPPKRKPGRRKEKVPTYYRLLAFSLAHHTRDRPERRGDRATVARAVALAEAEVRKGSSILTREEKNSVRARVLQIQNDLSTLTPAQIVVAAYCVRRYNAADTPETIKATLDAAIAGESNADREIFRTVFDLLAPLLIKLREKVPLPVKTP
jgi:hypothetical protein